MKQLLVYLLIILGLSANAQVSNFSFTNKPISDPELPNYGRGAEFWNGVIWNGGGAPQVPAGNPSAKNGYRRWWWYEMESAQGVYTFTGGYPSIEWHLKDLANQGMQLNYGSVMTAYDGGGIFYDGANSVYPQYLHELMRAEPTKDWVYSGTNSWIPNWNSPSYLARWRALQEAVYNFIMNWSYVPSSGPWAGKTVRGRDMLVTADVRGYGNFGEWHTWPWTSNTPANAVMTDSSYVKIVNATKDVFKNVPLHINVAVFDANSWGDHNPFRAWYALTQRNDWGLMGFRDDGIGATKWFIVSNPWTYGNWRADTALQNRWKYSLNHGEPLNGYETCCPLYSKIRDEVTKTHHWASIGNGNYPNNDQSTFDTMQAAFKLTGYRFNLNGGYMDTTLSPNQDFKVSLNWRNVGNAPLYQNRWKVIYQLKTNADVEVGKWTSKFTPFMYLPSDQDSIVTETFNLGAIVPGTAYKLTVKIVDTVGLCDPLFLAINSPTRNVDGSYTLRSGISVQKALPVKWYFFNGLNKNNFIELRWMVSGESSTQKFEVQRSDDGAKFYTISTVNRDSSYTNVETYKYLDYNVTPGNIFYRIKQIDIDGRESYSVIIRISGDYENTLKVYPNPAGDVLNVVVNNSFYGVGILYLYSIDGKLINKIPFKKAPGMFTTSLNISELLVGTYIMKVTINETIQGIQKIVKK